MIIHCILFREYKNKIEPLQEALVKMNSHEKVDMSPLTSITCHTSIVPLFHLFISPSINLSIHSSIYYSLVCSRIHNNHWCVINSILFIYISLFLSLCHLQVMLHLAHPNEVIVVQVLAFLRVLLYFGYEFAQNKICKDIYKNLFLLIFS